MQLTTTWVEFEGPRTVILTLNGGVTSADYYATDIQPQPLMDLTNLRRTITSTSPDNKTLEVAENGRLWLKANGDNRISYN